MVQSTYNNAKYRGIKRVPSRLSVLARDIGQWKVSTLYTIIGVCITALILLYITYMSMDTDTVIQNNRSYGYKGNAVHDQMPDNEISNILSMLHDTRPAHCKHTTYSLDNIEPASIILHYNEDEFYSMKLTLQSIVRNTPEHLYLEIVLFDDGSVRKPVALHALKFLKRPEFHKVKSYRSETIGGAAASRYKATKLSRSSNLIFIDAQVVVNHAWIEPLLSGINTYPRSIISSHNDVLRIHGVDGRDSKFMPSPDNYLPINTWSLSVIYLEGSESKAAYRTIPAMKGDVFIVRKRFLKDIGDYDDSLTLGGGHNLELGLRAWLCGHNGPSGADDELEEEADDAEISSVNARLKLSVCSRVAVKDDLKAREVGTKANARRIIELWYGNYKHFAYKQCDTSLREMSSSELQILTERRQALTHVHNRKCRDMHWYLKHVAGDSLVPTDGLVYFGQLIGSRTSLTFRLEYTAGGDLVTVTLTSSAVYLYDDQRMFELTTNGHIRSALKGCLTAVGKRSDDIPLTIEECDPQRSQQKWTMSSEGIIRNAAFPNLCLKSAVNNQDENIPRLLQCKLNTDKYDPLVYWKFVNF